MAPPREPRAPRTPLQKNKFRRTIAMGVIFLGAVLLIASLFLGWYVTTGSVTQPPVGGITVKITISETFLLGTMIQNSQSYSCTPSSSACPPSNSNTTTYSNVGLKNTGNLAMLLQTIVIAGAVLALFGGLLAFGARQQRQNWVRPATIFAVVAMLVALLAPSVMLALQPGAIHSDNYARFQGSGSSPANSFFGSCSNPCLNVSGASFTWGPTTGWYMSYAAGGVLLAGAFIMFFLARKPPQVT